MARVEGAGEGRAGGRRGEEGRCDAGRMRGFDGQGRGRDSAARRRVGWYLSRALFPLSPKAKCAENTVSALKTQLEAVPYTDTQGNYT